jgi:hypothetical protein
MARKNWLAGRVDRVGAWRLAVLIFTGAILTSLLAAHYNTFRNFNRALTNWLAISVFVGVLFGTMFLALEPHVRRRWPEILIGWTRLFSGRVSDPMVGRHVLYGVAGAMVSTVLSGVIGITEKQLQLSPLVGDLQAFTGIRFQFAALAAMAANNIGNATLFLFLLLGLRILLRNQWAALIVTAAIFSALAASNSQLPWFTFGITFVMNGLLVFYLLRFGLLATTIVLIVTQLMDHFPPDFHWGAWYASSHTVGILALAAITLYGFRAAVAGQKLVSSELE